MSNVATPEGLQDGNGFRTLLELSPDFVAVVDITGVISYVSPAVERVMGYLPSEVIGRPFLELVHPDDQSTASEDWVELLTGDEIIPANLRFRHKDGSFRVLETLSKNYSGTPEVGGVLVGTRDITQRVAQEKALRSALEEISDLYNNAPCGYHSLDENGIVVRINDTELRWLGRTREEVLGRMRFSDLLSATSLPSFERQLPVFRAQGRVDNVELELVCKDGSLMPVVLSATAITGKDGRFVMSRSTLYDNTERKQAESASRRVNRALRVISAVNSALIHAEKETAFLQNICRVCVELAGYRLAWVGFALTDAAKTVSPVAASGFEEGYLSHAAISWADNARGRGPTGTAIRTGLTQVNRDFLSDPRMAPWRDDALRRGYRSSIALPLKNSSGPIGALMIYAAEPCAFDAGEIRLLEEAADDLAFGICTLRTREQHRHAEEKIEHLAFFDQLTGLPNRNSLLEALGQAAERLRSTGGKFALLNLNVVRFSDIQSGIGV
ncbi:MAG: PAS domain S-box protein, partial [Halomonas sp.]|uniref:PAS domain S-box protein n=1 Tax=Halomonas sp. TaxID=1486246 RepID=UPI00286FB3F5